MASLDLEERGVQWWGYKEGLQGELGAQSWSWAAASLPFPCPKVDDCESPRGPRVAESDVFPKCLDVSAISSLPFCLEKACRGSTRTRGRTARGRDRHTTNSSAWEGTFSNSLHHHMTRSNFDFDAKVRNKRVCANISKVPGSDQNIKIKTLENVRSKRFACHYSIYFCDVLL